MSSQLERLSEMLGSQAIQEALKALEQAKAPQDDAEKLYELKGIEFQGRLVKVILQNRNGPCPLIALANVLILKGDILLDKDRQHVSYAHLVEVLAERLLLLSDQTMDETQALNFQKTMDDVLLMLPTLQKGLDVNVYFDSPRGFELTPALCVFDIFNVELVHAWVCDLQEVDVYNIVAKKLRSYNRVVETVVNSQSPRSTNEDEMVQGFICNQFLSDTASQITPTGMRQLLSTLGTAPVVVFRNNHFCTLLKHQSRLWTLVTDQGYREDWNIVWESVDLDGNSEFVDSYFTPYMEAIPPAVFQSEDEDLVLARQLQAQETPPAPHVYRPIDSARSSAPSSVPSSTRSQKKCLIQ